MAKGARRFSRLMHFAGRIPKSYWGNSSAYAVGQPNVSYSFCSYIDILGFSEMIKLASEIGTERLLLLRLRDALTNSKESIGKSKLEDSLWSHKFFTDNLVVGYPVISIRSESLAQNLTLAIADMIHIAATHQLAFALHKFAVRGAIAFGSLYMDHDIVFGTALLEAHDLESDKNLPRNPRIVLSEDCSNFVLKNSDFHRSVLRDSDETVFVNYLDFSWVDTYDPALGPNVLLRHKKYIERGLWAMQGSKPTYQKYSWLAAYHNYFCENTTDPLNTGLLDNRQELLIDNVTPVKFKCCF